MSKIDIGKIVGKRKTGVQPLEFPCELDYHCPVCQYELKDKDGNYDERLYWSEYNGFILCYKCEKDYPSALCVTNNIDRAIDVYLMCIREVKDQA